MFRLGQPIDESIGTSEPKNERRTGNWPAIDVEGLTKSFGHKTVVRNLSLKAERGTIYGFSRSERFRQDHDNPHDLRLADAGQRAWHHARL